MCFSAISAILVYCKQTMLLNIKCKGTYIAMITSANIYYPVEEGVCMIAKLVHVHVSDSASSGFY